MDVHLVDGTYELFRYHYSPNNKDPRLGATRGVVGSCLMLLEQGATHVAVATDHIIESFRNDLWATYKDGSGVEPDLKAQFPVVEDALRAAGFTVWPMVEQEADDAMAAGAKVAAEDDRVEKVVICTPDKDLGQCVGGKVWQWDRRQDKWFDAAGVHERLGVPPESVPDLLALVGDSADGFPGLPGWGAKSAAAVLDRWGHLESIPADPLDWDAGVRGAVKLNATLREQFELALLFRRIATVERDAAVGTVDEWRWTGPADGFAEVAESLGDPRLVARAAKQAAKVGRVTATLDAPTGEVVELLQALIRNRCVNDGSAESGQEVRSAEVLEAVLTDAGVAVERHESAPGRATLIARIEGSDPDAPSLCLLGHTDVVPVHEHRWTHDPFGGELIAGEVWGRGAIDMLNMTASMALAVRDLARDGFRPRGTLIYCAVADEEAFGHHGAEFVTTELADAVRADHLITESGGFPMAGEGGTRLPVLIGERGTLPTRLRVRGTPSHGSMPFMTDNTLVKAGVVAQRLAEHRPVPVIDDQWRGFVDGFGLDPGLTGPLKEPEGFNDLCAVLPPAIGRLAFSCTHTTIAPTMMSAGSKLNIIPGEIELTLDVRTLPGHGAEEVWAQIQDALGPELAADVDFLPGEGMPASSTPPGTPLWQALERTAQRFYEGSQLSPLLMPGATDARWWRRNLGTQCYGFGLFSDRMSLEQLGTMGHGDDERIDVESLRLVTEMWGVLARDFLG